MPELSACRQFVTCTALLPTAEQHGGDERFAGAYTFTYRDEPRRCEVSYVVGALYLIGVPELWPRTRLIPLEGARFAAESFPLEFTFVEDAGGIREMHASGPDFVWGGIPTVYSSSSGDLEWVSLK